MKIFLAVTLVVLAISSRAVAQSADTDLSVTLPSGKVVTFQTAEQKERFVAARARSAAAPAATPDSSPPERKPFGSTSLDAKPTMSGKVNVNAPTFTADYYLFAPETWVGKQTNLSIGYLTPAEGAPRKDGMRAFTANTWGTLQASGEQRSGGTLKVLASPAAAQRIATLCGTQLQYLGWNYKTTLVKGEFAVIKGEGSGSTRYGLIVTQ